MQFDQLNRRKLAACLEPKMADTILPKMLFFPPYVLRFKWGRITGLARRRSRYPLFGIMP
jgi:hypothetical protein